MQGFIKYFKYIHIALEVIDNKVISVKLGLSINIFDF